MLLKCITHKLFSVKGPLLRKLLNLTLLKKMHSIFIVMEEGMKSTGRLSRPLCLLRNSKERLSLLVLLGSPFYGNLFLSLSILENGGPAKLAFQYNKKLF